VRWNAPQTGGNWRATGAHPRNDPQRSATIPDECSASPTSPTTPISSVSFSRRLAEGEVKLAEVIEGVLAAPNLGGHLPGAHKVMLLSAPDDPETIKLPQPIKHLARGVGQAFVRKQRYTSERAIMRAPRTTADLIRFEHGR
jgi:hypothetical protein